MTTKTITMTLVTVGVIYLAPYVVYRMAYPDSVLKYVGGHVIRPSWSTTLASHQADFTLDPHSRSLGPICLGESFAAENVVSRLSEATNIDFATPLNDLFYPIARMDHFFTGQYFRFSRSAARPIFTTRKVSGGSTALETIDINLDENSANLINDGHAFSAP